MCVCQFHVSESRPRNFQEKFNEINNEIYYTSFHYFLTKSKKKKKKQSKISSIFQWCSRGNTIVIQSKRNGDRKKKDFPVSIYASFFSTAGNLPNRRENQSVQHQHPIYSSE
jgi:hypothetical protein